MLHHFHGGLHLQHHKRISCRRPLSRTPLPSRLFIPLLQHAGPEAEPLVDIGQPVLKGQAVARFDQPCTGYVHAPTSGTVAGIERRPITNAHGGKALCVTLESDGLERWTSLQPIADWPQQPVPVLLERIRDAGIVGLGGAVFPTSLKLEDAFDSPVHTLILNGAECEPYLSCDEMLMRESPDRIITGAGILQRTAGADQTVIAIEDRMGEVSEALQAAVARSGCNSVRIVRVATIYPEGGERQLIRILTGLEVPAGGRPTHLGLVCFNVATAAAVADAVTEGRPLVERIVTVTGNGVRDPQNVIASIGTPIADLIGMCGGYAPDAARLIVGGPMMGYALDSDQFPVVKAANCILVMTARDIRSAQGEMPCIRCGECARVCPASLLPQTLQWQIRNTLFDEASAYGLRECIECGCCDVVCPSHIPLAQWFRFGKAELRSRATQRVRAERARQRFEARRTRLDTIASERQKRLDARKSALQNETQRKRSVAEALHRARQASSTERKRNPGDSRGDAPDKKAE